jgi:hypothetical protein
VDVKAGDFDGDGKADITGRYLEGGQWWTAISTGSSFTTSLWATWNPAATWVDVQVADFNGDGKADLTGRYLQGGQWWTAISTGSSFTTSLWASWNPNVSWGDTLAADFNADGKADLSFSPRRPMVDRHLLRLRFRDEPVDNLAGVNGIRKG